MSRPARSWHAFLPAAALFAVLAGAADQASAQFSVVLSSEFGSTEKTGASARIDYSFAQRGDDVMMNWTVTNTTSGVLGLGATQSTLVGIAFDLLGMGTDRSLEVHHYDEGNSGFETLWEDLKFPPPTLLGEFQYGISPERESFSGGNPTTGLAAGESMSVSFRLRSPTPLVATSVETSIRTALENGDARVAGRFQRVNAGAGSDKVLGGLVAEGGPDGVVPEPSTVIL